VYKLFLTFRYLTRKKIVIFPILVVWLCVMMLIIVTSIMQGFVDRVRDANRELFGDIIISTPSAQGFERYDELAKDLQARFPEVRATTPVVNAYALLYVPSRQRSVPALLVGVRPEEQAQVSKFRESLYQQYQAPTETVELLARRVPATREELVDYARQHYKAEVKAYDAALAAQQALRDKALKDKGRVSPAYGQVWMMALVGIAGGLLFWRARRVRSGGAYVAAGLVAAAGTGVVVLAVLWPVLFPRQFELAADRIHQTMMDAETAARAMDRALALPAGRYESREALAQALMPAKASFDLPKEARERPAGMAALPEQGCFIGSQLAFRRDKRGNFVHGYPDEYMKASITVFPPDKSGQYNVRGTNAFSQDMTIVDDVHTGVYDVDSLNVYAPFELVQFMLGLRADPKWVAEHPEDNFPARAQQLLIKLSPEGEAHLKAMREEIDLFVAARVKGLDVQTWDERQARYLGAVENEATMMTFIMLLMSVVVLVVIFLIFYQIVRDKTKDIGIIKAVGGSEAGVASIFLTYGLMIGVVGGGLGALSGVLFMTHTNDIHEWIFQMTGIVIWDRSVYLFDRIPDVVRPFDVVLYYAIALVSGVAGAIIPAVLAALEDPVQAVRYE
jgi:ABC-type lipoprotein release transport system permease subunit